MKKYILALDLGTTSIRAIVFDKSSNIIAKEQKEFTQFFPYNGWVEQDGEEIWQTLQTVIANLMVNQHIDLADIESIGITNQRETTLIWDVTTGLPIYRAIVWQSMQTNDICETWKTNGYEELVKSKTGLPINPYFSASKIRWILDHVKKSSKKLEISNLRFGTIDSWILWKLTGEHKTDGSNASRTMLYNIFDLCWDKQLCEMFDIDMQLLPEVCDSSCVFAKTNPNVFFHHEIPICAIAGDQQASMFGHGCFEPGIVKNTYGTGCFLLMNVKDKPYISQNGLLTTIAWSIDGVVDYAIEGSIFVGGSAVQWLRDSLQIITTSAESESLAKQAKEDHGVFFVPAFVGLGSPYWDNEAKGTIFGLTRGSGKAEIARATLDSIAYQTRDVLEVIAEESKQEILRLRVDGGASENELLMQFQADITNTDIDVAHIGETTALGVAYLAGLATGFWKNQQEILQYRQVKKSYRGKMSEINRNQLYQKWKKAVAATILFK